MSPSDKWIVFYGQQVYGEYSITTIPAAWELPSGCYIRNPKGYWYCIIDGMNQPLINSDIPPEVRMNCLLLGISV